MPMTTEQKEWTSRVIGTSAPGAQAAAQPLPAFMTAPEDPAPGAAGASAASPKLVALYAELGLQATEQQLSRIDPCWSSRLALYGAWAGAIAATAGTVALILAPEPTTLTKWAALATAAAVVSALVGVIAATGSLASCIEGAADADQRKKEIDDLRRQQQEIQKTVDELKKQIGSK